MTSIADANVLFPLLVDGHVAHQAAQRWWDKQPDDSVGLPLPVQLAVLRLLTNKVAMNDAPVMPGAALDAWRQLANDPRCFQIDAPPEAHEGHFTALVADREPTPNLWTDAWLAATAQSLDYEMVTFDRGFRSFAGLRLCLLRIEDEFEPPR